MARQHRHLRGQRERQQRGLTSDGKLFDIALNRLRAGRALTAPTTSSLAAVQPDGHTLFINIQASAADVRIWGPWVASASETLSRRIADAPAVLDVAITLDGERIVEGAARRLLIRSCRGRRPRTAGL